MLDREAAGAATPRDVSAAGWLVICGRVWRHGRADNLNMLAAAIAFYVFLALLPFLATVAMAYALFADREQVLQDIGSVLSIVPGGVEGVVADRVADLIAKASLGPLALLIALVLALYSAARGARTVVSALNVVFRRTSRRHALGRWGLALAIAAIGAGLLLLALFGIAFQGYLAGYIPELSRSEYRAAQVVFWIGMALAVSAGLALLYRFAPAGEKVAWRWLALGAVAGAALWLAITWAFGAFVASSHRLEIIYGGAAALVVLQLWLYLSALAMLTGAKLAVEAAFYSRVARFAEPAD